MVKNFVFGSINRTDVFSISVESQKFYSFGFIESTFEFKKNLLGFFSTKLNKIGFKFVKRSFA